MAITRNVERVTRMQRAVMEFCTPNDHAPRDSNGMMGLKDVILRLLSPVSVGSIGIPYIYLYFGNHRYYVCLYIRDPSWLSLLLGVFPSVQSLCLICLSKYMKNTTELRFVYVY